MFSKAAAFAFAENKNRGVKGQLRATRCAGPPLGILLGKGIVGNPEVSIDAT